MDDATGEAFAAWLEDFDASIKQMPTPVLELLQQALARAQQTGPEEAGTWLAERLDALYLP
jgi:hypothetical protein